MKIRNIQELSYYKHNAEFFIFETNKFYIYLLFMFILGVLIILKGNDFGWI